jgi:cardiolipin synthase
MTRRIFTVPNQLTFLRLGFLPLFIILIFYRQFRWALVVLLLAGATDGMDGLLARSLNQKSKLGAYLDPIADKLLLSSSFVVLAFEGYIRWWLTILVIGRDILILITATVIMLTMGFRQFPPSIYGKLTTTLQIILVFAVLCVLVFNSPVLETIQQALVYVVAGLTVFSGFHYSVVVSRRLSQQ